MIKKINNILYSEFIEGRNINEHLFMFIGIFLQLIAWYITKNSLVSLISGVTGIISVILCSQRKISFYFFGFIQLGTYMYLAWQQRFYGELIENVFYIITMLIVLVGWIFFNSSSVDQIIYMIRNLFGFNGSFSLILLNNQGILYLLPYMLIAIIGMGPWINQLFIKIRNNTIGFTIYDIYLVVILVVCLIFLINNSYNPFIYFRF